MTSEATSRWRANVSAPGIVSIDTEAIPAVGPGEALISMRMAGVCGSDTHAYHGKHPQMKIPYYPGHEVVGIVEAVGADVEHVAIGQRVTPEPTLPCGTCKVCQRGDENVCENLQFFGCGYREGGMASVFTVPADRLRTIPEEFTDEQAILIEPLATPVHAARLAGDLTDRVVLIHGCGTIGLLMLAAAKHAGARRVVMTDLLQAKRDIAVRLGADVAIDPSDPDFIQNALAELGEAADTIFDCVSIQSTVDASTQIVSKAGVIVIVGVPARPVTLDLPTIQDRQIRVQGAATYVTEDYDTATEIIRAGLVDPDVMVSKHFGYQDVQEAFDLAATGVEIKVVLTA